jgi:hypothetical protein
MAKLWTVAEFALTDALYEKALVDRRNGRTVRRADLIEQCQRATDHTGDGSVVMHLGNLTAARAALGLPTLPEMTPLANFPKKLVHFLQQRHAP